MAKRSQLKLAKKDLQNQNPDLILLWKTTTSKSLCGAMFIRTPSVTPSQKCEKLFTNWGNARNVTFSESPIPDHILASEQKENLWMAMPVRHRDKEEYGPPYHRKTSHHLLGIQRHIKQGSNQLLNQCRIPTATKSFGFPLREATCIRSRYVHQENACTYSRRRGQALDF